MRRLLPLALLLAFLLPHCTTSTTPPPQVEQKQAAAQDPLDKQIPLDPAVRTGVLPNGMTYYVRANAKPEKRAELRLVVNAGSVLESEEQRGLAHFVEHMAFNGTESFKKQELVNYMERIGMRFGPEVNAYTSFDETVYMLKVPTDDPKIVQTGLHILHDWASAVTFDKEEVEKERGVLVEEWRLGRGASGRIRDKQVPVIFHGSQYAERLPIGKKEIIEKAPRNTILKFYRDWYRPDLMAVVAVGDFDPAAMESQIREQFKGIRGPKREAVRKELPIPDHTETLTSVVTDPEATGITVEVDYKRPPFRRETVGDLRKALIDSLYHSMMMSRLSELGREANPPWQGAFAASGPMGRTKSAYRLYARVNNGGVERALTTLLTEARRVDKYGFAETELNRAKTMFLRSIDRAYDDRDKQESVVFASQLANHFLEHNAAASIAYIRDLYHELIPAITLDEVNARAGQWITDNNRVILVSGPEKKEAAIPDEPKLLALFNDAQKVEVTPWIDRVRDEPLVAEQPKPGTIVEETKLADVDAVRWTLSNGAIVILKPTDFKNDEVLIRASSWGGESLAPDGVHITTSRAAGIVAQMGLGKFDTTELQKALTGKVAYIGPYIGETSEGVSGSASPRDLETAFQLLYLRFTAPHRDEKAFSSYLTTLRGQLENQEASPEYAWSKRMNEVMTQNHPRRRFLTMEDTRQIDMEKAVAFYQERFANASDFVFTIVGSFDAAVLRPLVEKWIGGLPSTGRVETWRDVGVERPGGVQKVKVEKGIEPRSRVRIVFHGKTPWSLDEDWRIASLADILEIRLREELREDKGGVYGVSVGGDISRYPRGEYTVNVSFATDPNRVDELVTAIFNEIKRLKTDGPAEDYVNRVREMQRRERETQLKRNSFWAYQLEYHQTNDLDFKEILRDEERRKAVTTEAMRDAARKYLDETRYVIGVLDPEKKAASK